jgi:serine acetyltransferase
MRLAIRLALLRHRLQLLLCCQIPRRYHHGIKFPHPLGIVIGDGVRIGKEVRIYQNVTIGLLKNTPAHEAREEYPTIEDGVIIYAGAVIAGPITIGSGATIGANSVITHDVPRGATAFGRNQIMPAKQEFPLEVDAIRP